MKIRRQEDGEFSDLSVPRAISLPFQATLLTHQHHMRFRRLEGLPQTPRNSPKLVSVAPQDGVGLVYQDVDLS